jgi:steroid 5-alpha reductase family enzyme
MSPSAILGISAGITACIQLLGFAAAYQLQTETFYDVLGGINFLVLGAYSAYAGQDIDNNWFWINDDRKVANTVIFSCSRAWLLVFLAWRAHERGGDSRFDDVKDKFGLFLLYWTVQGVWVFTISMPAVFVNAVAAEPKEFSALDSISIAAWAFGVVYEIIADVQKASWVRNGRQGTFCQVGVWSFSRHPNYFAEILQWLSAWLFAYGSCSSGTFNYQWFFSILSPLFTMHILLNTGGTGVMHANGKNLKRYYDVCPEEYARYRENTSILIPFVGYKHVPKFLKRTIFLDLERYEYKPSMQSADHKKSE